MTNCVWDCVERVHCCLRSPVLLQSKHEQGAALGGCGDHFLAYLSEEGREGGRTSDDDGDILLAVHRIGHRARPDSAAKVLAPQHLAILGINSSEIAMEVT